MKNLCEYCKYTTEYGGCLCGIENLDSPDGYGCNYSEEMLSLLNKYTEFEISEAYSYRTIGEFEDATSLEEELKEKQAKGEEIGYWDKEKVSIAWKRFYKLRVMDAEYTRCNYLRFFEKHDPKGKLRRHLKRKGQYPYWIHNLFYVEKYEKHEEKV